MKKHIIWLVVIYLLLAIGVILLMQLPAAAQTQYRIFKVDTVIKQTVFCRATAMTTGDTARFHISFRGAGKLPDITGQWVTYIPEGLPRRRHIHYTLNN